MQLAVALSFVSLALVANEALAAKPNTYLIKSVEINNPAEALTILRRFMPTKLKPEDKCEKYAVMLNSITRSRLDQFKLAEIGLEPTEQTRQQFRTIDVETLRQLYIDGINTFRQGHIDSAMLDLVECLSKKFRTLDAKARSFLNNQELQEIISQYKSVMSQPLDFLVDPAARHPELTVNQLKPSVKQTLLDLFNQDESKVTSRFGGSMSPQTPHADVIAHAISNVDSSMDGGAHPLVGDGAHSGELDHDELEFLHAVIGSIHELYNKLPVESKLGDRCNAYGKIIQSDQEHLNFHLVDQVVQEVADKIKTSGPSDQVYNPSENVRENFLFTLSAFPKEDVGQETWIDLVDCVSQWVDEDPRVQEFMNSPEQMQIFDGLMKAPEDGAAHHLPGPPAQVAAAADPIAAPMPTAHP